MKKKAVTVPQAKAQRPIKWSVSDDGLRPIGELLIKYSRDLCRPGAKQPTAIDLWSAYREHKLEFAIVCLEVAVSVPFADRVRKRTRSVFRQWDRLQWDASRISGLTLNDPIALDRAREMEDAKWRRDYPNGLPWNESPPDTFDARWGKLTFDMEQTGTYLLQAATAVHALFGNAKSITKADADRVTPSQQGRPIEKRKRALIADALASGKSGKETQNFVKETLGTEDYVSRKMISEVKKKLNEPPAEE